MTRRTVPLKLVPPGLIVDRHEIGAGGVVVHARSASAASPCPTCGLPSSSVHSHYSRTLGDVPAHGRRLRIRLAARRFRCRDAACERRVFTERFSPDLIQAHARRTSRLDGLTHAIALVLGGRPGERLAERLSMPVGADTLLRLLRRRAPLTPPDVRVVGIDDFAWLKGQRYGTIICDLERRRTIDLLPDREGATVANWLAKHPGVEIVCRDRGSGYREGAAKGAPQALQISDRWHLLENASAAFLEGVKRHMGHLRRAVTNGDIDPDALSAAEKLQWTGWQRRDEMNGMVRNLHGQGHSIKGIVRTTGVSRQTVRRILAGTRDDVFRSRETTLDRWAERLNADWDGGCRNGAELWRRLRHAGYGGSQRVVTEWATRRRRATKAGSDDPGAITTVPPARTIARLLTSERDCKSAEALPHQGGCRDRLAQDRRGAQPPRSVPDHGRRQEARRSRVMAHRRGRQRTRVLRLRHSGRRGRGEGRHDRALVKRADRRPDHQTQARQAPDVWPREDRPPARSNSPASVKMAADQHQVRARAKLQRRLTLLHSLRVLIVSRSRRRWA